MGLAAPIQRGHMTDPLNQLRTTAQHEFGHHFVSRLTILGADFHLDQFMVFEGAVEFGNQVVSQTLATNEDDRAQGMRKSAQIALLGIAQLLEHKTHKNQGWAGYHAALKHAL